MEYRSKQPVPAWTPAEARDALANSDHGFLAEWAANAITDAFGLPHFLQKRRVDSTEFKGLQQAWDDDGNALPDGTIIFGADAADLAEHICRELNVSFLYQQGRGSRLRACVAALQTWLKETR